jgi:hypothetical protein
VPAPKMAANLPVASLAARRAMRIAVGLAIAVNAALVSAELPPPSEEAKARADETKAKTAWSDKVTLYQTCLAMDRTAEAYRKSRRDAGQDVPTPVETGPCIDPGPYVSPVAAASPRPLEAAGAHSPPERATSPPSTAATTGELPGGAQPKNR